MNDAYCKSTKLFRTIRVLSSRLNYCFSPIRNRQELQAKTCKTFLLHELLGRYKTGISDEAHEHFHLKVSETTLIRNIWGSLLLLLQSDYSRIYHSQLFSLPLCWKVLFPQQEQLLNYHRWFTISPRSSLQIILMLLRVTLISCVVNSGCSELVSCVVTPATEATISKRMNTRQTNNNWFSQMNCNHLCLQIKILNTKVILQWCNVEMGIVATFPAYLCKHSSALYKQFLELFVIFHRTLADNPATKEKKKPFFMKKESIMHDGSEHC